MYFTHTKVKPWSLEVWSLEPGALELGDNELIHETDSAALGWSNNVHF